MANVMEVLIEARDLASSSEIPGEWQEAAFVKAVEMLWEQRKAEASGGMAALASTLGVTPGEAAPVADSPLGKIASRLRIGPETVEQVFHVEDGRIDIVVPGSRLDSTKARATKQLAILITAARQGAELEEWTDAEEVRHLATEFRRYDSANFASTLKELDDVLLIRQTGRKVVLKLSRPGWEAAAGLVRQLAGEG